MNMYGDKTEAYRNSGIFYFKSCQNLIIRNLSFVGPGSIDVGGSDLVSFYGTKNSWVDHCDFADGMDGNFDITQKSDFNTVSWCIFRYTERAYMHQNTNLVGSSDSEAVGFLNTTYAFNNWSKGCKARMPMARVGKIHMLNNYYDCTGNGSNAINPRKNSEFLIEGNYFEKNVKYYGQNGATAVTWSATNHIEGSSVQPSNVGSTVTVPYDYTEAPVNTVPEMVKTNAGATLTFQESAIEDIPVQRRASDSYTYNIMGQRVSNDTRGIVIKNGKKYFQR
jgi:pectate lyase